MGKNIGIDLGTTNSCISYLEGREAMIVPNPEGARVIPSVIGQTHDKKRIFGNAAKRQMITNSKNTIWGIKRLIGRKFDSPEIKAIGKRVGYDIVEAENGDIKVKLGENLYSTEEISGMFLGYLKTIAENYLGEAVGDTVITVPAFFNDAQRQATKVAGEIAGLTVTRIINEPTAALIAYGQKIKKNGLYAVYDLGGGTFDISIVEVNGDIYKVVSTLGDTFLGGSDFDAQICDWIFHEVERETTVDLRDSKDIVQRVILIAEKAKIELSFDQETLISIPYLHHFSDGSNYHFQKKLTRSQLESFTVDFIDRTLVLIKRSLSDIGVKPEGIERTILVGGQSRMPIIFQKLSDFFGKSPRISRSIPKRRSPRERRCRPRSSRARCAICCCSTSPPSRWESKPRATRSPRSLSAIPPYQQKNPCSSPPLPTTRPRSRFTCSREKGRRLPATSHWAFSTWSASPRR